MENKPLFAYGPLSGEEGCLEVLGRRLPGSPAVLDGFRLEKTRGYSYLAEAEGEKVEGVLYETVQPSDYWVLDEYQNVEQGLFRREAVEVKADGKSVEAFTYLGGPTL